MASDTRLFVGRLGHNMRERDLHDLFSKYGRIVNCSMKTTYGFVEFENPRDARDAVNAMDGYRLDGSRIAVEFSKGRRNDRDRDYKDRERDRGDRDRDRDRDRGDRDRDRRHDRGYGGGYGYEGRRGSGRYSPPYNSEYRITVNNLPTGCSWQDLKDYFRQAGDVCFSDVRRSRDGHEVGVVEFKHYEDMKEAVRRYDRTKLRGSTISIVCEYEGRRSGSRSPRRRSGSRRRSPRKSGSRSRSLRRSGSRSRSPRRASKSPAREGSKSQRDGSKSPVRKSPARTSQSPRRSRSGSPKRSHSPSPVRRTEKSPEQSRSPERSPRDPTD